MFEESKTKWLIKECMMAPGICGQLYGLNGLAGEVESTDGRCVVAVIV